MDIRPSVSADGSMILWLSDRMGHRATDASAEEVHVFGAFLTQEGLDAFRATPEERARRKPAAAAGAVDAPNLPSLEGLPRRTLQLSQFPADVLFYRLAGDGRSLVVVSGTPAGLLAGHVVDIASQHARQLFVRPPVPPFVFTTDPAGTAVYALGAGGIDRYDLASGQSTTIRFTAEFVRDVRGEIAAIFEHAWRLTQSKFYDATTHGVDWVAMGANYRRFLPRVQHWEELAEILSEMVGELNASHQGASYLADSAMGDATGSLGVYYDGAHRGPGQRIAAILPGGPADRPDSALRPGAVVMAVDGVRIGADDDISRLLNRTAGRPVLLAIKPESGPEVEQIVTPISPPAELALAYARWVERRRALVDRLSQGRLGYIHIPHMNVDAYRQAYSDLFGRHRDAEGVVIDIRHNGGGNLHDQLLVMLTGEHHSDMVTRYGAVMGRIPSARWAKPSAVVANAASYSDGSVFPALYQRQALGPIIGERVPGTGTAVLWERQLEPRLVYGVPQIGFRFRDGTWFENREIVPDVLVRNDPAAIAKGGDPQLEAAVAKLLATLKK
jgi:tricorn protease